VKRLIDADSLARELASLSYLDREALIERWRKLYGSKPPVNLSHRLLVRAIAYRMQEQVWGSLRPATRHQLATAAKGNDEMKRPTSAINPGTRLIREWHGHTYEVVVLEDGMLFQGKEYRSLTEVARIITGVHWSGPTFFGLKSKKVMRS
jgi:hypothetical protein